jgi:hypothetical protein
MLGDTRRSELFSQSANWPAELHGGPVAGELESPENTPRAAQGQFDHETAKQQAHGLGVTVDERTSMR